MLTNLVKLRYVDPPVFLDIAQLVTQYTIEGSASIFTPRTGRETLRGRWRALQGVGRRAPQSPIPGAGAPAVPGQTIRQRCRSDDARVDFAANGKIEQAEVKYVK